MVLGLADRWHQLPEAIENMDASVLRMLEIEERGRRVEADAE